jgi:hypothetical protein
MEAAGACVIEHEKFGSYQGESWALVEFEGKRGWVHYEFGSCGGCDSFEAAHLDEPYRGDYRYPRESEECFSRRVIAWKAKLADFGRGYLDHIMNQEEAEKVASRYAEFDMTADRMISFLKQHAHKL